MISRGLTMRNIESIRAGRDAVRSKARMHDFLLSKDISPFRSYGNKHVYKCPIHAGDNSPSFYVYEPEDGHDNFFCFGCKKWGDVVDLKSMIDRMSFEESYSFLCQQYGVDGASVVSESDLLDAEIHNWDTTDKKTSDIDVGAMSFSMGRLFRNLTRAGKVSILNGVIEPSEIVSIMANFDKCIRTKNYDDAYKAYSLMQGKFSDA